MTNLRESFINIIRRYEFKPLSSYTIDAIKRDLDELFHRYGLEDLRYRLEPNINSGRIEITPIRPIDTLAFIGIDNMQPDCFFNINNITA